MMLSTVSIDIGAPPAFAPAGAAGDCRAPNQGAVTRHNRETTRIRRMVCTLSGPTAGTGPNARGSEAYGARPGPANPGNATDRNAHKYMASPNRSGGGDVKDFWKQQESWHMTTRFSLSRIGRASLITIGAIAAMAAPLGAQAPARAKPAAQTPAPTGPVMDLSMDQAVNMSMETNLGLKAAKINVDVAAQGIVGSRAAFLPQLRGQVSTSNSDRTASSFTDLGATTISNGSFGVTTSVSQFLPWYGGSYQVAWSNSRSTTSSVGASFNPTLSSSFSASYTQPLLQGFKVDSARVGLE